MVSLIRFRNSLGLFALLCALIQPAWAADDVQKAARAHVMASQRYFNLGQFAAALKELEAAYQLKAAPGLLFNMAQCHRNLHQYERAAHFFRAYVESGATGEQAKVARTLAAEMEQANAEQQAEAKRAAEQAEAERNLQLQLATLATEKARADAEARAAASAAPSTPVYKKWWFWTAIGVVAVGAAGATTALIVTQPQARTTSLGEVNLR